jgi:ElaB/YqjD/DUF883 family membrane-anchored ribosome-binding protein
MATTSTPGKPFSDNTTTATNTLNQAKDAATDAAKNLAAQGSDALNKGTQSLKETSRSVVADVKSEASTLAAGATEKARSLAEDQKNAGAERLSSVASAVDRAAGDLEEASPHTARLIRQAAAKVEDFSSQLRDSSVDDLVTTARDFARRQPVAVFGGAVVAGILLSRFLKSTAEPDTTPNYGGSAGYTGKPHYPTPAGTPRNDWASTTTGTGSSGLKDDWSTGDRIDPATGEDPLSAAQPQPADFGTISGGTKNGI